MSQKDKKVSIEKLIKEAEVNLNSNNHDKAKILLEEAESQYDKLFHFSVKSGNPDPSILLAKQKVLRYFGTTIKEPEEHYRNLSHMMYDLKRVIEYSDIIINQSIEQGSNLALEQRFTEKTEAYTELAKLHLDPRFQLSKDDLAWGRIYFDKAISSARELNEFTKSLSFSSNAVSTNILSKLLYMRADLKCSYMNELESSLNDLNEGTELLEELIGLERKHPVREDIKQRFPNIELIKVKSKKSPAEKQLSDFMIKKGHVYSYMQKTEEAINAFQESDTPTGYYYVGEILYANDKIDQAINYFIKAINKSESFDHVVINSLKELETIAFRSYKNAELIYENDKENAIIEITRSIDIVETLTQSKILNGEHDLENLHDFRINVLNLRGYCYDSIGENDLAIADYKRMNNYFGKYNIGHSLINMAEYEEAISYLAKSIEENPGNELREKNLLERSCQNLIYSIGKIFNQEYEWYNRFSNYNTKSIITFSKCIDTCKSVLKYEEKIGHEFSDKFRDLLSSALNSRGIANQNRRRLDFALEDFEESNTPLSLYNAAQAAFKLNQFDKTKMYLDRVILQSNQEQDRQIISQATLFLIDLVRGRYV